MVAHNRQANAELHNYGFHRYITLVTSIIAVRSPRVG